MDFACLLPAVNDDGERMSVGLGQPSQASSVCVRLEGSEPLPQACFPVLRRTDGQVWGHAQPDLSGVGDDGDH